MKKQKITQMNLIAQNDIPDFVHSGKDLFLVNNNGTIGIMDDLGGQELFEEDWELIKNGWHEGGITAVQLEVTIN